MSEIRNKVVVITGASSGIGEATAIHLAQRGAKVVLGARGLQRLENQELSLPAANVDRARLMQVGVLPVGERKVVLVHDGSAAHRALGRCEATRIRRQTMAQIVGHCKHRFWCRCCAYCQAPLARLAG